MGADDDTCGGLERRGFLGLAMGGAASMWTAACGDAGVAAAGTGTGASTGTEDARTATVDDGATAAPDDDSTSGDGESSIDTGSTPADSSSDASSTGDNPPTCQEEGAFEEEWLAPPIPENLSIFPLAVMAGEMRPNSAMFAVVINDSQTKILRVWRAGSRPGTSLIVAELAVTPTPAGYAKVTVEGLCPGTWYFYVWLVGNPGNFTARSAIGQVRTAIADDALEPLTIAISACHGDSFDWPAMAVTADEPYDMFLHLGDMAYNDGAFSLQEYRESWRQYLSVASMRLAYARAGLYATWDDHEIDDNSNFDRETMDPQQLQKRQNAMDAYFEVLPIDAEGPNYRLWRSFRWGLTAEIFVLDCRYERRPSAGLYMSQAQMDWLMEGLASSPCHFKIIMNSVPITNMPGLFDLAANDRWEGYPDCRDQLLQHISRNDIDNVWFVSGDFHVCFVSTLEAAPVDKAGALREIAVTGGRTNILGGSLGVPQFAYATGSPRGCVLTLDPRGNYVNVRFIDPATGIDAFNADLSYD